MAPVLGGGGEVVEGEPEDLVEAGEKDVGRGAGGRHPPHLGLGVRVHLTRLLRLEVGRLQPSPCIRD